MKYKNENKKRIAVISSCSEFTLFFELEAKACSCPVRVFPSPPQELSEFDLVVLDLAAGYCFSEDDACEIAAVSTNGKKFPQSCFDYVWEWPVSIQTVREAYEGDRFAKENALTSSVSTNTVYFLSDQAYTVVYRNQTVALTQSEWRVLRLLAEASNKLVDREALETLFDKTKGNLADVHICHLRKKLEVPFGIRLIETVRGKGYCLRANAIYL